MKKILISTLLLIGLLTSNCFANTVKPFFGNSKYSAMVAATTYYFKFGGGQGLNTTEAAAEMRMPGSFTFSNLKFYTGDPGFGNNIVITLRVNNADTVLTCTMNSGSTSCSDTTHSVSTVVGDRVSLKVVTSAALGGAYYITRFSVSAVGSAPNISLVANATGGASTSSTLYGMPDGLSWSSTENLRTVPVPTAGSFKNMTFGIDVAPGAGKSYTYTLKKNGSNTAVTCAISDSNTSCIDTTNTASVVAGDTITFSVVPSGTPTAHNYTNFGMEFDPTTDGESVHFLSSDNNLYNSVTNNFGTFPGIVSGNWNTAEEWGILNYAPIDITFKNLYVVANAAPGGSASWQVIYDKDYAPSTLTCTITGVATTCNDTTHSEATTAGMSVDIGVNPSSTPTSTILKMGMVTYVAPATSYSLILVNSSNE